MSQGSRCVALSCASLLWLATGAHAQSDWTVARPESALTAAEGILETRWTSARPPFGPGDRIELHRYRSTGARIATLLYLPGTNMNGEVAVADENHNLWVFLARRGIEVFALDYRTRFAPATAATESRFMQAWTMEAFVDDARAAAALARRETGRPRLFIAGFSRGVSLAYLLACVEKPDDIAGVIALDGFLKNHAPANTYDFATEEKKLEQSGAFATDVAGRLGWEKRQELMLAAAANPSAPAPDTTPSPGDGTAALRTIGEQVARLLYGAWGPGALANPVGGMSRPEILARLLAGYDRFYPAIQDIEGRSIADRADDPRTSIDDRWGELAIPVLYFGNTNMGADWLLNGIYSAGKSGSKDVTINVLERYGHLDVIVGEHARQDVFEPTRAWMETHARPQP